MCEGSEDMKNFILNHSRNHFLCVKLFFFFFDASKRNLLACMKFDTLTREKEKKYYIFLSSLLSYVFLITFFFSIE